MSFFSLDDSIFYDGSNFELDDLLFSSNEQVLSEEPLNKDSGKYYFIPDGFEIKLYEKEENEIKYEKTRKNRIRKTIPRPRNCFIIYRQDKAELIREQLPGIKNCDISKIVSQFWKNEVVEIKKKYIELAKKEKLEHQKKYPEYKFSPQRPIKNKKAQKKLEKIRNFCLDNQLNIDSNNTFV